MSLFECIILSVDTFSAVFTVLFFPIGFEHSEFVVNENPDIFSEFWHFSIVRCDEWFIVNALNVCLCFAVSSPIVFR